ncbi:MAG: hypothetical protein ABIN89_23985 [Chitinophagaceae bacterium]
MIIIVNRKSPGNTSAISFPPVLGYDIVNIGYQFKAGKFRSFYITTETECISLLS